MFDTPLLVSVLLMSLSDDICSPIEKIVDSTSLSSEEKEATKKKIEDAIVDVFQDVKVQRLREYIYSHNEKKGD